jgi:hypothetical protein
MIAGPFESHTLGGRRFACDAEDDAVLNLGGRNNEIVPNGDGTTRNKQTRVVGNIEGTNLVFDLENGDVEYLSDLKNGGLLFDYSGTTNDGIIYSGSVQIVDDLKFSFKEGTVEVTLSGSFEKQG